MDFICGTLYLHYAAARKGAIKQFSAVRLELEDIMLTEVSQKKKDKRKVISYNCGI